jgi:hypothetical protein
VSKTLVTEGKEPVVDKDFTTTESLIKMQRAKLKHVEQEKRAWDKTGIFENKDISDRPQNPPKVPEQDDINKGPEVLSVPPPRGDKVSKTLVTEGKEPVADKDFKISKNLLKSKRAELKHVEQEKRAWDKTGIFENKDMLDRVQNNTPESSPSEIEEDEWG